MARPTKNGLDYFPLDVHIFEDEKIEAIAGEFGIKGELAVIKLLCAVYEKGYFVVWNDLTKAKLLKRLPGTSKDLLEQVVNRLVTWEFFNKDLFNSAKVLTSKKIQDNYFEATKRRKMPKPSQHVINADNNSQVKGVNVDINPQSKVNKTKVNKTKASETSITKNSEDSAVRYWLNQVNPAEAPFITQSIQHWVNDFGGQDEIIILAIDDMLKHGARSYKYLDAVLRSWENKQLDTVEKVKRQLESHYAKPSNKTKSRNSFKQVTNYGQTLYTYYEQELRFSPNLTLEEYASKKRLNDRDVVALKAYSDSLEENA